MHMPSNLSDISKIAEIVLIFTSGSAELYGNYRPISLLTTISKLFKKCLYNRQYKFFDKLKLLFFSQFALRHRKSTADAVLNISDEFIGT